MRTIRFLSWAGVTAMVLALLQGFVAGGFLEEGSELLGLAWGRVTLTDLAVGFVLAGAWIGWRERSPRRAVPWLVLLVLLGNLTTAVYVGVAAARSSDPAALLLGPHRR